MTAYDRWLDDPYQREAEADARAEWEASCTCTDCRIIYERPLHDSVCTRCLDAQALAAIPEPETTHV